MNKSESITNLAAALCKFQAAVDGAKKTSDNPYYKSKYADLAEIWRTVRKPLTDNGLSVTQLPAPAEPGLLAVETVLLHESGEWVSGTIVMVLTKSDPQGAGSAITYARRYGLAAILGIHQEDDDAQSHNVATAPKATTKNKIESAYGPAHTLRLDISGLVGELKAIRFDNFDSEERRKNSYVKHLGVENPNQCSDTNLLSAYREYLLEKKDKALSESAKTKATKARAQENIAETKRILTEEASEVDMGGDQ